jgi:hypothetical protein
MWEMSMKDRRINPVDRRQQKMPETPFKDSSGATVRQNRRYQPDRRVNDMDEVWADEGKIASS